MNHRFINKNTYFEIEFFADENDDRYKTSGIFLEMSGNSIYVKGDDLLKHGKKALHNPTKINPLMHISFNNEEHRCEFVGKVQGTYVKGDEEYIDILPMSPIEEKSRRSAYRHAAMTTVTVNYLSEDGTLIKTFEGLSDDISIDAILFFSNEEIESSPHACYEIAFKLFHEYSFTIMASLLRRNSASITTRYKYSYIFIFNTKDCKEDRDRLAYAFLQHAMSAHED